MRVYIDAAVDYLLLLCSARLSGFSVRQLRLALAAALGGVFAAGSFVWAFLRTPLMGPVMLACVLLTAYGTGRGLVRLGGMFLLVSLALAGLVQLVALVFDQGLIVLNRRAYYPVSAPALLITAGVGYLAAQTVLRRCIRHGGELARVTVRTPMGQVQFTALRDTGNTLLDPLTGRPVLIVDWQAVKPVLPMLDRQLLATPTEAFAVLSAQMPALGWRLLPYRVVGGSGLLLGFRAQTVQVDGKSVPHMTVALSPTPVSDGGGYMGLLGGEG